MIVATALPLSTAAGAAQVDLGSLVVTRTLSYQYSAVGGDVIAYLPAPVNGCDAFWLAPADAGRKTNLAILMSAVVANRKLRVYADNAVKWAGSAASFCKLYALGFEP